MGSNCILVNVYYLPDIAIRIITRQKQLKNFPINLSVLVLVDLYSLIFGISVEVIAIALMVAAIVYVAMLASKFNFKNPFK